MPERCIAARCDNKADPAKGIIMHRTPFVNSKNPIAQKRRRKWINFVLARRKNWEPRKTSSLCSIHFKEEDFQFRLDSKMKQLQITEIAKSHPYKVTKISYLLATLSKQKKFFRNVYLGIQDTPKCGHIQ